MGFFDRILPTATNSVAIVDISSGSVAGGYISHGKEGTQLEYGVRRPVVIQQNEQLALAVLRALSEVDELLIKQGAPILRRATGSGSVGEVLVSIASPWQETMVRIERVDEKKPFLFTRAMMSEVVQKTAETKPDRVSSGESVIATLLNGYETNQPFGKEARLADIVVLSSSIDKTIAQSVETALRRTYHTRKITFAAFAPLAYTVFRDVYPHEKDYLVVDVSGEATDIAFVKHGLLAAVVSMPLGVNHLTRSLGKNTAMTDDMAEHGSGVNLIRNATPTAGTTTARSEWVAQMLEGLKIFSEEHALPRTIFLLADEQVREYLRRVLDDTALRSLWLSSEPLSIVPVLPTHFLPFIKTGPDVSVDSSLLMLALFHGKHIDDLRT
jgi:hypothetical protein